LRFYPEIDYEPFLIWNTFHFRRKEEKCQS
jgi:hypothetical protein